MVVEQPERGVEVGDLGEPDPGQAGEGFAAGEPGASAADDPVEDGSGVLDDGVGGHGVEHGEGVRQVVVAEAGGVVDEPCGDGLAPAGADGGGEVEQSGDAGGGAGEFGGPVGEVAELGVRGEARFEGAFEVENALVCLRG